MTNYYTILEFAWYFRVTGAFVRLLISRGDLRVVKLDEKDLIPESEFDRILGIRVPVTQFDVRSWLSIDENRTKLDRWRTALNNRTTNVLWYEMSFQDYLAYWCLVVRPEHERHVGRGYLRKPSYKWLERSGFKGFLRSFNDGYLWKDGIRTASDFFKKVEEMGLMTE